LNLKPVDNAIIEALLQNGPTNNNELHRIVQKICPCTEKTCREHASKLAELGRINRNKKGQNIEYSLNYNKNDLHSKLSKFLDELTEDSESHFDKILKGFKKYGTSKKYSELKPEEKVGLFFLGSDSVNIVLGWYQLLLLLTIGGFGTSDIKQKARKLQKIYNRQLQELFQTYRKIDQSFARVIFSNVFDELYPRAKRPEDSILI